MDISRIIADRVRTLRAEQGLSRRELAHRSGVAFVTLAKTENAMSTPSLETVCALADGLGCQLEEIVPREAMRRARGRPRREG